MLALVGGDEGADHLGHMAAGQEVGFDGVGVQIQARLHQLNACVHNDLGRDAAQGHGQQVEEADVGARGEGAYPGAEEREEQAYKDQDGDGGQDHQDGEQIVQRSC